MILIFKICIDLSSSVALVVKNLPDNAGDAISIPGSEDALEEEMAAYSSILAWEIPWTEELGGLQLMESQKSQT